MHAERACAANRATKCAEQEHSKSRMALHVHCVVRVHMRQCAEMCAARVDAEIRVLAVLCAVLCIAWKRNAGVETRLLVPAELHTVLCDACVRVRVHHAALYD